jgi:predicted CoA-binding protein
MSRLDRLLRPKSVAVVGGGFFAPNVVKQCLKMGFAGEIWPVHPSKDEVAGVKAYRSLADLPSAPDATFIGVNRNLTIDIVRELRELGAGGAICFAAGFRETAHYDPDGSRLQDALIEAAGDLPVIGPNCYGLINYADGHLGNGARPDRGFQGFFARPAHRRFRFRRRLRAVGGARSGVEKTNRRYEGRPLRAGAGGDGFAHGLARRLGCGIGCFPEAARHSARRHYPDLPRDAEAAARSGSAG